MLDAAIQASNRTQSEIRRALGYKSRSQLSHYATGLYPVPIGSAERIAEEVGLDPRSFLIAVLRQRHPEVMGEMLVPCPFDPQEIAAMRARLNEEGRPAALDLLLHIQPPVPHSVLKA
ncbi:hypothetical protein [Sphingomonas sp. 3-13AW]|uniref:hypothetical protein n=1 Tax=Sphingomonas sp. 3-13AW TaxID=3050450 RepID=UPI003BB5EDB7